MFSATYFTYDGVFSGEYGLMIADFDVEPVVETAAFSPVLNAIKPADSHRFFHGGIKYDTPPTHRFSVISEQAIPDVLRREILAWLVGRNEFKKFKVHQPDLEDYYYNCVFTDVDIIYINTRCHGFRVTANFDSPYARGESTVIKIPGGAPSAIVTVDSDVVDGYVYPIVEFYGDGITIVNETDNGRNFGILRQSPSGQWRIDNELRRITFNGSASSFALGRLGGKVWFRLRRGINDLMLVGNDEGVTITIPRYVMMGF